MKTKRKTPPKEAVHYTASYIVNPMHPVTVNVVGCGGTGSQVLNSLARMHMALQALGHPGFHVKAIDPDRVSHANIGRQLFSPADVGHHKCMILIGRLNRFFGTEWQSMPMFYNARSAIRPANITISCVDSGAARKGIYDALRRAKPKERYEEPYYWMDFGNMQDRGQVVIGTLKEVEQPKESEFKCLNWLPSVNDLHPDIFIDSPDDNQGPSCSLAEALSKQDLFINTDLANMGLSLLWQMFRNLRIKHHGCYLNLSTMSVNPIPIR